MRALPRLIKVIGITAITSAVLHGSTTGRPTAAAAVLLDPTISLVCYTMHLHYCTYHRPCAAVIHCHRHDSASFRAGGTRLLTRTFRLSCGWNAQTWLGVSAMRTQGCFELVRGRQIPAPRPTRSCCNPPRLHSWMTRSRLFDLADSCWTQRLC